VAGAQKEIDTACGAAKVELDQLEGIFVLHPARVIGPVPCLQSSPRPDFKLATLPLCRESKRSDRYQPHGQSNLNTCPFITLVLNTKQVYEMQDMNLCLTSPPVKFFFKDPSIVAEALSIFGHPMWRAPIPSHSAGLLARTLSSSESASQRTERRIGDSLNESRISLQYEMNKIESQL
jgi:hypothetical protein